MDYKYVIESSFNEDKSFNEDVIVNAIDHFINLLNSGKERIAVKKDNDWIVNEYLKKAILLYFRYSKPSSIAAGNLTWFDKIPVKNTDKLDTFRHVPGAVIRYGAYISDSAVIMPSFINIGAYIDSGSMIDSFTTIGSCAQIGKNCHISEGVCIGGVLEPINSSPVIIEDNCFIGAKSAVTEGIVIRENTTVAAGTILTRSTKIFERESGMAISWDRIPKDSLIVPGSYAISNNMNINCAVVMNKLKDKDIINKFLR